MEIVDAQIHIWGSGLPVNDAHWQVTRFDAAQAIALMDEAGVDAAVIHPPGWDPGSCDMAARAIADHPGRFAMMKTLKLDDPETPAKIAAVRDAAGVLGLRYVFMGEDAVAAMREDRHGWLWRAAEEAGVPVAVLATDTLAEFGAVAARHPGLKLTIDHLGGRGGFTRLKDHAAMAHMPQLLELARHPNVAVKATGAPGYSGEAYPFPIMQDYLRRIFDAFGPERMFWGTDISKMPCSWRECVTLFTEELDWLTGDDLRLVMGAAFRRWWGWPGES